MTEISKTESVTWTYDQPPRPADGQIYVTITPTVGEETYVVRFEWPGPILGQLDGIGPKDLAIIRDAITETLGSPPVLAVIDRMKRAEQQVAQVWAMAERGSRKGYDLDPDEVLAVVEKAPTLDG